MSPERDNSAPAAVRVPPPRTVPVRPRRRSLRRPLLLLGLLTALLLTVALVDAGRRALAVRADLVAAHEDLLAVNDTLAPAMSLDAGAWPSAAVYADARERLTAGRLRVEQARERLGWVGSFAGTLGGVPRWGEELEHSPRVLALAERMLGSAERLLDATAPLFDGDGRLVDDARTVLVERRAAVDAELAALDEMAAEAEVLRALGWDPPFEAVAAALDTVLEALGRVPEGRATMATVGDGFDALFGYGSPSDVLLLGQNDHEIRPTGGFIGTMGVLRLEQGSVVASDYRASREFDPPALPDRRPPPEFSQFFGAGLWFVRDANWWPDFPTSAREVRRLIAEDAGVDAPHVVAIDTTMVRLLLGVLGPVSVPEFPEPLTGENWFAAVEGQLAVAEGDLGHDAAREAYLRPVLEEVLRRAEGASREQAPALLAALREGIAGRHLQIYSEHPAVQAIAERFGAAGRVAPPAGEDFVAIVDANLSYSKIQPAIRRDVTYLRRSDGVVDLLVTWTNELPSFEGERYERFGASGLVWNSEAGEFRRVEGTFGGFTRVYLPGPSEVLAADGFEGLPRRSPEGDLHVVSGFIEIGPGEQQSVHVAYRPPDESSAVTFWKQGGMTHGTLRVLASKGDEQAQLYAGPLQADMRFELRVPGNVR